MNKIYILDTNIIIKIWSEYPFLFKNMESNKNIDFKIYKPIAKELYVKESREFDGMKILTDRFIKLLDYIINEDELIFLKEKQDNLSEKYDSNKKVYHINGNKLSKNDYELICLCESYSKYTLVTEDKSILKVGKSILNSSQILAFNEFFIELKELGVI